VSRRFLVALTVVLAAGSFAVAASGHSEARAPVIRYVDDRFGAILATPRKQALYYWRVEKRANGRIRCTRGCARAWPPLIVSRASAVPRRIPGIRGVFGTVRRPDGRIQVKYNGLAVYTYAHERPEQVLCDNVDGWFVVRLR
jgi:predicted lipoprotein with Yx(FWY)xxD motif